MSSPVLIVILGPTAIGKTAWAIEVAEHFQTEIISADSRQLFREMRIGVARPSEEELQRVPHHFIATTSIHEHVSAGTFAEQARTVMHALFEQHDVVVCAGGSMLYVDALLNGMDDLPGDPTVRANWVDAWKQHGVEWLAAELEMRDPDYHAQVDLHNPHRLIRALEICTITGKTFSSLRTAKHQPLPYQVIKIGVNAEREVIYDRINQRVLQMMEQGFVEEVKSLLPHQHLNALNTVGYKEIFEYLAGACTLNEAIERIQQHTRQFAKRQLTWWRRDEDIHWFSRDELHTKGMAFLREAIGR